MLKLFSTKINMRTTYRHLREEDRRTIYRMNKDGSTQREMAVAVGCSQSTISKELKRNRGKRGYRASQAQSLANSRQRTKRTCPRKIVGELKEVVEQRVRLKHSPEQISGSLAREAIFVSHETIYKHIFNDKLGGGDLHTHLRINGKRRYRRRNKASRNKVPNRIGIEERPKIVDQRRRYGDWEADLVEGSKGSGYILSIYERKSRYTLIMKLESKHADQTAQAIIEALSPYRVHTITYDNGLEFSKHETVSRSLKAKGYFCKPYHSWEKGGVENYNGLLRQYYPKGSDFSQITHADLKQVEKLINDRPRKSLNYQSPSEKLENIAA